MTAALLVATLRARGVTLLPDGDRLRVRPAEAVTPDEIQALKHHKPAIMAVLSGAATDHDATHRRLVLEEQYRTALRVLWDLNSRSTTVTPAAASVAVNEVVKLLDEVGEPTATSLRRRWMREWFAERGCCPTCGGPDFHNPDKPTA